MPQSLHIAIIGGGAAGILCGDRGQAQLPSRRHHDFREEFEGSRQGGNHGRRRVMQSYQFLFDEISDLKQAYPRGHKLMKRLFKRFDYQHAFD